MIVYPAGYLQMYYHCKAIPEMNALNPYSGELLWSVAPRDPAGLELVFSVLVIHSILVVRVYGIFRGE